MSSTTTMNYETKTHYHRTQNTQHVHTSHTPLHSSHSPLHSSRSSTVQVPMPVMASVSGGARAELPQLLKGELVWRSAVEGRRVEYWRNTRGCHPKHSYWSSWCSLSLSSSFFPHINTISYFYHIQQLLSSSLHLSLGVKVSERASNFDGHMRLGKIEKHPTFIFIQQNIFLHFKILPSVSFSSSLI